MTETPTEAPTDWVAAYLEAGPEPRDRAVHNMLRDLHRALDPEATDSIVVESFHDPATDGWRVVMHRIPYVAPAPETPEEEEARRVAVLEEALADPRGLALAKAIIERKDLHEALASFKPGGTSADDDDERVLSSGAQIPLLDLPGSDRLRANRDRVLNQEKVDAFNAARDAVARPRVTEIPSEAELRADLSRPKTGDLDRLRAAAVPEFGRLTRGDGPAFA